MLFKNRRVASIVAIALPLLTAAPHFAAANIVLDQGFDPGSASNLTLSAGFGGIDTNQHRAETFVAGITGTLAMVDVEADRFNSSTGGNLTFEIVRQSAGGAPSDATNDLLMQINIPSTSVPQSVGLFGVNTSSANLNVTAGEKLAIVMFADASTPSSVTYQWNGETSNPYPNGTEWEEDIGNHNWINEGAPWDLGFETFVLVPEPASTAILVTAAAGVLLRRRKLTL